MYHILELLAAAGELVDNVAAELLVCSGGTLWSGETN